MNQREMATDIDYFFEKNLNTNVADFFDSLPDHLKGKFQKAFYVRMDILYVLQGYRGPSHMCNGGSGDSQALEASDGVQEIKFYWGTRKDLNFIPFAGTVAYILSKLTEVMTGLNQWISFFFDSKTGEYLAWRKIKVFEKLHEKGDSLLDERKLDKALEYFKNAESFARSNYSDDYAELREGMKYKIVKCEIELKAIDLYALADCLFEEAKYSDAIDKYREALCDLASINRDKAITQLEIMILCTEAETLFERRKYKEVQRKYHQSYNKFQDAEIYDCETDKDQTKAQAIKKKISKVNTAIREKLSK